MNVRLKSVITGAAVLALTAGGLAATAGTAFAATSPWEPDPNSNGSIVFYNAAGAVVTGGSDLSHIADYAAVTTGPTVATATKATLFFAAPDHTKVTGLWFNQAFSGSTTYPNPAAPAPLTTLTKPYVSLAAADGSLTDFIAGAVLDTTAGYNNVIQVRIKDSGPGGVGSGSRYWDTNILVNVAAGTWTVNDALAVSSTTTLTATPPSPQTNPASPVTLSAAIAPTTAAGTVKFFDGATQVGATQTVVSGAASVVTTPALGDHPYTAVFTPAPATLVNGSTSNSIPYHVGAPQITTTTALSANPSTSAQFAPVVLTANVAAADAPATAGLTGAVAFFNGATNLGAGVPDAVPGEYKLTTTGLPLGTDSITAVYTPTSSLYSGSTSAAATVTITAAACPGVPDGTGATCSDPQPIQVTVAAGSLTITTPYTATNPFVLPSPVLNAAGTLLVSSAPFPKVTDPAIVVHSSLAGNPNWTVSVTSTDLTGATPANKINGANLGLTGGSLNAAPVFAGTVSFTGIPAANGVAVGVLSPLGLAGGPHTFAQSAGGGNGSAAMTGILSLNAPTNTAADTYTGTITFSVA